MSDLPPLPDGYVLDGSSSGVPALPDGYVLNPQQPPPQSAANGQTTPPNPLNTNVNHDPSYLQNVSDIDNKYSGVMKEGLQGMSDPDLINRAMGTLETIGGAAGYAAGPIEAGIKTTLEDPLDTALGYKNHSGGLSEQMTGILGPTAVTEGLPAIAKAAGNMSDMIQGAKGNIQNAALSGMEPSSTALATTVPSKVASRAQDILKTALSENEIDPNAVADGLEKAKQTGLPVVALDHSDMQVPDIMGLARMTANMPGSGRRLAGGMASRDDTASDRIGDAFDQLMGDNTFYGVKDQVAQQQKVAGPFYKQFYAANQSMNSPIINNILSRPAGKQALQNVAEDMQNKAQLMAVPDPELTEQARDAGIAASQGVGDGLKGQTLDYVKQELDKQAQAAKRASQMGDRTAGRDYANLSQMSAALRGEMDKLDVTAQAGPNSLKPEGGAYAQARKNSAQGFQMDEALENGRNFMKQDPEEIQQFMQDPNTSDPQKAAYMSGARRALQDQADKKSITTNPIASLWRPNLQKRLQAMASPDDYQNFATNMGHERNMEISNNIIQGSQTQPNLNYQELLKSSPAIDPEKVANAVTSPVNAAVKTGLGMLSKNMQAAAKNMDNQTAGEIMRYLSSDDPDLWRSLGVPQRASGGRVNLNPTDAQKAVGNYKKDHIKIYGLDVTIENPKGSVRRGKDKNGKQWESVLPYSYGYLKRTIAADGDHVDVCLGPKHGSPLAFVVDQLDKDTGKYDEAKVFLGYLNQEDAIRDYKKGFSDGKGHEIIGNVTRMTIQQLKDWLKNGDTKNPVRKVA